MMATHKTFAQIVYSFLCNLDTLATNWCNDKFRLVSGQKAHNRLMERVHKDADFVHKQIGNTKNTDFVLHVKKLDALQTYVDTHFFQYGASSDVLKVIAKLTENIKAEKEKYKI